MFRNRRRRIATTPLATRRPRPFAERAIIVMLGASAPLAATSAAFAPSAGAATTPNFRIALSTHQLPFGMQDTAGSKTLAVRVRNTGKRAVTPVGTVTGSAAFNLSSNTCSGHPVAPGKSCSYTVTFSPSTAGAMQGQLQVRTSHTPAQKVALTGTGVLAQMQVYTYRYTYSNPPVVNGQATPQSYAGVGYAPADTYVANQIIPVYDATGLQVGSYQIEDAEDGPLTEAVNTVGVTVYHWGSYTLDSAQGLSSVTGTSGLGSEGGTVWGHAFNNQHAGIVQGHS